MKKFPFDKSLTNFAQHLKDPNRKTIKDWENPNYTVTHKMSWATGENGQEFLFSNDFKKFDGELIDFTDPKNKKYGDALESVIQRKDTLNVPSGTADWLSKNYKHFFKFKKGDKVVKAQEGSGTSWWTKFVNTLNDARDAKIGAVGAQQVRDLYSEGKTEEAEELTKKYTTANAAGIILGATGGSTLASAAKIGWVPTLTTEAGSAILGTVGTTAGKELDKKFNTKWISPVLGTLLGIGGGIFSYKGLVNLGAKGLLKGGGEGLIKRYNVPFISDVAANMAKNADIKIPKTVALDMYSNGSFKSNWRDQAIYMRHHDLGHDVGISNLSDEELLNHFDLNNFKNNKTKEAYLDRTYNGQYTVSPLEWFDRLNNTGDKRVAFMLKHPLKTKLPNHTNLDKQIKLASRPNIGAKRDQFIRALNTNTEYNASLPKGTVGYSEGNILYGDYPSGKIYTAFAKDDFSPLAKLTLGHEGAVHASRNLNDEWILRYLDENKIVDMSKVAPYFKDADRGEIGAHLSELASWLGFTKNTPKSKYITPEGKTKITKDDIINFRRFNEANGFLMNESIFGNILDWDKFLDFINNHPFAMIAPIMGASALGVNMNDENNKNDEQ